MFPKRKEAWLLSRECCLCWFQVNLSHNRNNAMPKGGKIGQKQSFLKRIVKKKQTKRKSKFNECKHKKFPVEQARNAAAEITFTMLWVNRFHARCFEKNCRWMHRKLFQWSIDPKGEIPEGYRLVSIDSLVEFARRIHSNSPCSSGEAIIFSFAIQTETSKRRVMLYNILSQIFIVKFN